MNNEEKVKVVGYMRVSTDRQTDGVSKDTQQAAIQKYADANNMEVVDWYWDGGFSAKTAKRPELQRMLKDIESKKYMGLAHVVVYNTSRISRNLISYAADIGTRLASKGVTLRSTQEAIDDTPTGKLMQNIAMSMHQFDNDLKSRLVRDNMKTTALEGWWTTIPPVGMKIEKHYTGSLNASGKKKYHAALASDETNNLGEEIANIIWKYHEGMSVADLVRYAEKRNIRDKKSKLLNHNAITRIVVQPAYGGYIRSSLTDGELVKAKWDGIVPIDVILDNIKRQQGIRVVGEKRPCLRDNPQYPLKNVLRCSHCGRNLRGSAPKCGSGIRSPRYHCPDCLGIGSVKNDILHEQFEELLQGITPTAETLKLFRTILKRALKTSVRSVNAALKEQRELLNDLDRQQQSALEKLINEQITRQEKDIFDNIIAEKRATITQEITRLEGQKLLSDKAIDRVLDLMEAPAHVWHNGDLATKQLIQAMVFPNGIPYDLTEKKLGTSEISPLYSVISTKKAPEGAENTSMVVPGGIEPPTSGL